MDTIGALMQVMMFKDVADPVLHIVAKAAEEVTIPAGETIGVGGVRDGEEQQDQAAQADHPPTLPPARGTESYWRNT